MAETEARPSQYSTTTFRRPWWSPWRKVEVAETNVMDLRAAGSSLVAAAARLTESKINGSPHRRAEDWMAEAWTMFDIVGELHFLATTLAHRAAGARFYVGTVKGSDVIELPDPEEEAAEAETAGTPRKDRAALVRDSKARRIFNSLGDGFIGVSDLIERGFMNQYVVGASYIVGAPAETWEAKSKTPVPVAAVDIDKLVWRSLSLQEFGVVGEEYELRRQGALDGDTRASLKFPKNSLYVIVVWSEHPADASLSDSPVRATLPVLRELVGLTMHVSAQIDSRLAGAGMLVIRSSISRAMKRSLGLPEDGPEDPFTTKLIETMLTPISNRDSAAAVVPFVVTIPDETKDLPQHISFSTPLDAEAGKLREEAIRRIALSLDAPPELLLGQSTTSHWTAWLTQEEVVDSHISPTLALFAKAFTTRFLRPILRSSGLSEAEANKYAIWYDTSKLTIKANIGADAQALYELDAISDETLRRANGFDESDAPKKADVREQAIEIVTEQFKANPGLMNRPGLDVMLEQTIALLEGNPQSGIAASRAAVESSGSSGVAAPSGTEGSTTPDSPGGASAAPTSATPSPTAPEGNPTRPPGARRAPQTSVSAPGLPQTRAAASGTTEKFGAWDEDQLDMAGVTE